MMVSDSPKLMDHHPRTIPTTIEGEEADLRNITRLLAPNSILMEHVHATETLKMSRWLSLLTLAQAYAPSLALAELPPKTVISSLGTS